MSDPLIIAGREFGSRLFLGTAGYPNRKLMLDSIAASGTEMVTASIRRISLAGEDESLIDVIPKHIYFLPNTAGCQTAKDAVLTAELAREALETNWIKLEVIGDRELLYPDTEELVRATETLVAKGFIVLPYCTEDPVVCRKLADAGAAAVMPLGAPNWSARARRFRWCSTPASARRRMPPSPWSSAARRCCSTPRCRRRAIRC